MVVEHLSLIQPKIDYLQNFASMVKDECVLKQKFFSIFDLPDFIVKKKIPRKEYEEKILKMLKKVKKTFLH